MDKATPRTGGLPIKDWPLEHGYIGKASPREGNGWSIRIYALDPVTPDRPRLVGMTECSTLEHLEEKSWDFVHALDDSKDVHLTAAPDIGDDIMTRVIGAWAAMNQAKEAETAAAKRIRDVVRQLRDLGLSVTDIAFLTHVSRGRVSQLLRASEASADCSSSSPQNAPVQPLKGDGDVHPTAPSAHMNSE